MVSRISAINSRNNFSHQQRGLVTLVWPSKLRVAIRSPTLIFWLKLKRFRSKICKKTKDFIVGRSASKNGGRLEKFPQKKTKQPSNPRIKCISLVFQIPGEYVGVWNPKRLLRRLLRVPNTYCTHQVFRGFWMSIVCCNQNPPQRSSPSPLTFFLYKEVPLK